MLSEDKNAHFLGLGLGVNKICGIWYIQYECNKWKLILFLYSEPMEGIGYENSKMIPSYHFWILHFTSEDMWACQGSEMGWWNVLSLQEIRKAL